MANTVSYEPHARLIAALAETMSDQDWASDVLFKLRQIEHAVENIRRIAQSRAGGER